MQAIWKEADIRWVVRQLTFTPGPEVRREIICAHFHIVEMNAELLKALVILELVGQLQQTEQAASELRMRLVSSHLE